MNNNEHIIAQYLFIKHRLEKINQSLNEINKQITANINLLEKLIKDENDKKQLKIDFDNPTKPTP